MSAAKESMQEQQATTHRVDWTFFNPDSDYKKKLEAAFKLQRLGPVIQGLNELFKGGGLEISIDRKILPQEQDSKFSINLKGTQERIEEIKKSHLINLASLPDKSTPINRTARDSLDSFTLYKATRSLELVLNDCSKSKDQGKKERVFAHIEQELANYYNSQLNKELNLEQGEKDPVSVALCETGCTFVIDSVRIGQERRGAIIDNLKTLLDQKHANGKSLLGIMIVSIFDQYIQKDSKQQVSTIIKDPAAKRGAAAAEKS